LRAKQPRRSAAAAVMEVSLAAEGCLLTSVVFQVKESIHASQTKGAQEARLEGRSRQDAQAAEEAQAR
jgi:hypothetical protein